MGVFLYELRRTTRRGRPALIRSAYGVVLLFALGSVFLSWFGPARLMSAQLSTPWPEVRRSELALFAHQFTATFLLVQLGAILVLTPAYAAGAIAEERQRRTLDDLLVTQLSSGSIVLGKLAARWLHVAAVLIAGLPVLSLMQCWGGVDLLLLLAGFAITLLASLSLTGLSLYCSVREPTVPTAVTITYLLAGVVCTGTSFLPLVRYANPIVVLYELTDALHLGPGIFSVLAVYALWHLALTVLLAGIAAVRLRSREEGVAPDRRPDDQPMPEPERLFRLVEIPPVGDEPLLWKEQHFGGNRSARELFRALSFVLGSAVLVIGFGEMLPHLDAAASATEFGRRHSLALAGLLAVLSGVLTCGVAIAAASGVSREREQGTLDGLLSLPGGREPVLRAKWLGSLLRVRWLTVGLLTLLLVGVLAGRLPATALLLAPVSAIHAVFAASLGVYLSVVRSTAIATFLVVLCLLTVCLTPWLVDSHRPWLSNSWPGQSEAIADNLSLADGFSPPLTWLRLTTVARDELPPTPLAGPLLGAVVYVLAGRWFWWRACVRFEREANGSHP
jgi:ABC-type transport system involved in multi-copper enzyme maturation permease subunit